MRIALLLARVTAACITTPASAEIFRCSTAGNVLGLDPCLDNEGPTNAMKDNIYEGPLHRAWTLLLQPALASEREQLEPTR